jgi:hypothetical protein
MAYATGPRLTAQSVLALPTRTQHDDAEADDDGEKSVGHEKRQKLNLWKCKQCREARQKVDICHILLNYLH